MRDSGDHLHHPYIVRCAISGTASANVNGQTMHSTLSFDFSGSFMSMGDKKKDQMRTVLKNLMFLIIDEFSMVKSDYIFFNQPVNRIQVATDFHGFAKIYLV